MEQELLGQGADAVREVVAWISGITGLSSLAAIIVGVFVGSKIIKGIIKLLLTIVIIAAGLFIWSQIG